MTIHPSTVLDESLGVIEIGKGTVIGAFCHIRGPIVIGANNRIDTHVVLGADASTRKGMSRGTVRIGDGNVFCDFTTVQRGTGARDTAIGSNCYVMTGSVVCHDVLLEDEVTLSPNVALAGHVSVLEGATLGMQSCVHQYCAIGQFSMVGMGTVVTRDVPPFALAIGNPGKVERVNVRALERLGHGSGDVAFVAGTDSEPARLRYHEKFAEMTERFVEISARQPMIDIWAVPP